jgi:hypothetical protein
MSPFLVLVVPNSDQCLLSRSKIYLYIYGRPLACTSKLMQEIADKQHTAIIGKAIINLVLIG